jgi:hypothetical protein
MPREQLRTNPFAVSVLRCGLLPVVDPAGGAKTGAPLNADAASAELHRTRPAGIPKQHSNASSSSSDRCTKLRQSPQRCSMMICAVLLDAEPDSDHRTANRLTYEATT